MAYTPFGEFVRILRIKHHQVMGDMAKVLGASTPFLSAVENGKKNMPDSWYPILQEKYSLNDNDMDSLKQAAMESQKTISLNLKNASSSSKQLAVSFARQFDEMDEITSQQILNILNKRKKGTKNYE